MANQRKVEHAENSLRRKEELLSTPEFLEPRRASYLRKSIAWDNAFFSSDGIYTVDCPCIIIPQFIFSVITVLNTLLCTFSLFRCSGS